MQKNAIIFFDGLCNFCNSSVNFIIKRDRKNYFKFSSLQSEFAKNFLESYNLVPKSLPWQVGNGNKPSRKVSTLSNGTLETKQFETIEFPDSIILFENNKFYIKSTAALKIAKHLNGLWKIFFIFIIIPPIIRDFFYDIIAKNRYKWFEKKQTCMLPDEKYKKKFLV